MPCSCHVLPLVSRTADRSGPRSLSRRARCLIAWRARSATRDVCRAKSCTRRGRWRAGCAGSFAAGASSTWAADMACSHSSCCCSTILRPRRWSSTRRCHRRARSCTSALVQAWPRLSGRIAFVTAGIEDVEIQRTDVVVSSHACGRLTDLVLERAVAARARVAVLPCCHDLAACDAGTLSGWVDGPVAVDILRAHAPRAAGLSHLDAGHSRHDHAEEPPVAWRAREAGLIGAVEGRRGEQRFRPCALK